jgi:hypothetical protein
MVRTVARAAWSMPVFGQRCCADVSGGSRCRPFQGRDPAQQPAQKVGSRDDPLLPPPRQDGVGVDDVVGQMLSLHLHASDHITRLGSHMLDNDGAVPIGFRPRQSLVEQHIAKKVMGVEHQLRMQGSAPRAAAQT